MFELIQNNLNWELSWELNWELNWPQELELNIIVRHPKIHIPNAKVFFFCPDKNVFLLLAHTSRSIHDSTAPHCSASSLTAGSSFPLHPRLLRLISPHSLRLTFFCRLLLISWIENVESLQCALQKVVAISGKIIRVNPCVCCARPVSLLNSAPTGGGRRRRNESDHYRLLGCRVTHRLWVIRSCKRVWPTKASDFCK